MAGWTIGGGEKRTECKKMESTLRAGEYGRKSMSQEDLY